MRAEPAPKEDLSYAPLSQVLPQQMPNEDHHTLANPVPMTSLYLFASVAIYIRRSIAMGERL